MAGHERRMQDWHFQARVATRELAQIDKQLDGADLRVAIATRELENHTGFEARVTTLGHLQRGGTPTATDRVLATRYGIKAAELVAEGQFGRMAALRGDEMTSVPLSDVTGVKEIDLHYLRIASTFFG